MEKNNEVKSSKIKWIVISIIVVHLKKLLITMLCSRVTLKISFRGVIKATDSIVLCFIAQHIKLQDGSTPCCQPVGYLSPDKPAFVLSYFLDSHSNV